MSNLNSKRNVLDEMRNLLRRLHYSIHTERAYCDWVARYIRFHHLKEKVALLNEPEKKVEAFLTHLAVQGDVAASTQNQAFNALVFYILERKKGSSLAINHIIC